MCRKLSSDPRLGRSNTGYLRALSVTAARQNNTMPARSNEGKGARLSWDKRIERFMKDFTCPQDEIDRIIAETKVQAKETDSDSKKYQIAYNKFIPIMMTI